MEDLKQSMKRLEAVLEFQRQRLKIHGLILVSLRTSVSRYPFRWRRPARPLLESSSISGARIRSIISTLRTEPESGHR